MSSHPGGLPESVQEAGFTLSLLAASGPVAAAAAKSLQSHLTLCTC